jgi:hypothetical protein
MLPSKDLIVSEPADNDYTILFHIPCVVAKPGIPLMTSQEYYF